MIAIHQDGLQSHIGKSEPAGLIGDKNLFYGLELFQRGYVVICPDRFGHAERRRVSPNDLTSIDPERDDGPFNPSRAALTSRKNCLRQGNLRPHGHYRYSDVARLCRHAPRRSYRPLGRWSQSRLLSVFRSPRKHRRLLLRSLQRNELLQRQSAKETHRRIERCQT
jgi:hypothetical protein